MAELVKATPLTGPLVLDVASSGASGRVRYRRVIALELPLGGATGARVDPSAASLLGTFRPLEFEVRSSAGANLHGSVAAGAGGAIVEFEGRFAVRSIEVTSGVAGPLSLHRLDGATAADATLSAALSGQAAAFPSSGSSEFFDVRFAVRAAAGLASASAVRRIVARGYPTGPRVGLADPDDMSEVDLYYQAPGEHRSALTIDAGLPFGEALARYVEARSRGGELGDPIRASLVVESDVPCEFELTGGAAGLTAQYAPRAGAFGDGSKKHVLRFSEASGFRHEVRVSVPAGASIARASLRVLPSFRRVPAATSEGASLAEAPSSVNGVFFDSTRWLGQALPADVTTSGVLAGVALAITALTPRTVIQVELQDDAGSQPSGRVLAQGELSVPRAGAPLWLNWGFDTPELSTTLWLVVTARQGTAIWLASSSGAESLPRAHLFSRGPAPGPFQLVRSLSSRHLLVEHLSATSASSTSTRHLGAPFSVSIGERLVSMPDEGGDDGSLELDLAEALSNHLGSGAAGDETPLVFSSGLPGILTVYAPEIELA